MAGIQALTTNQIPSLQSKKLPAFKSNSHSVAPQKFNTGQPEHDTVSFGGRRGNFKSNIGKTAKNIQRDDNLKKMSKEISDKKQKQSKSNSGSASKKNKTPSDNQGKKS